MNEIVITGANGYLGSSVFKYLRSLDYNVRALIRKESSLERLRGLKKSETIFFEDLFTDKDKFSVIIHCATLYKADKYSSLLEANIGFPIYLINNMLEGVGYFINIDTSLDPETNLYSKTKNLFKNILKSISENDSAKVLNLQLEYFFDESEPDNRFIKNVVKSCLNDINIKLTEGEQIRDFIYLNDVCEAIRLIIENKKLFTNNYNNISIGSGKGVSIKKLATTIKKITQSKSILEFGAIPYREDETMYSVADINLLSSMGWSPSIELNEMILEMIDYIKKQEIKK